MLSLRTKWQKSGQKLAEQGIYLEGSSAQSLNDYAQKQISVWADVLKAGKIASE